MADQSPQKWAENFFADLVLDGERIPFDRVVELHRQAVSAQRAKGLTWKGLANLLRRAGATREDGKAYSADHLRVAFGRTEMVALPRPAGRPADPAPKYANVHTPDTATFARSTNSSPPPIPSHPQVSEGSKDVSDDELSLADPPTHEDRRILTPIPRDFEQLRCDGRKGCYPTLPRRHKAIISARFWRAYQSVRANGQRNIAQQRRHQTAPMPVSEI